MNIYILVETLINYGIEKKLIEDIDKIYLRNQLLEKLKIEEYVEPTDNEILEYSKMNLFQMLDGINEWAFESKVIESKLNYILDIFDGEIMNLFMQRPSDLNRKFWEKYEISKKSATDYYYSISKNSNYIRTDRIKKNISWTFTSNYGEFVITINMSKPEKDPREIALERTIKISKYPKCLLCLENEGYHGRVNHPPRQNHRVIKLNLKDENWYFQYSPYVYFNEHSIIFSEFHRPMKIDRMTFERLFDFLDLFPHYFIGSNADIPIVGGSMLGHDHYQSGCYLMPMNFAKTKKTFSLKNNMTLSILKWPLTVLRLRGDNKKKLVEISEKIRESWEVYENRILEIIPFTENEKHNSITPIARRQGEYYEIDLVLRNNRQNEIYPDGIFHPHKEIHPIKKENIGLIEVMGLAVLPSRLKIEIDELVDLLDRKVSPKVLSGNKVMEKFTNLYAEMYDDYFNKNSKLTLPEFVEEFIGKIFVRGLEHSGVFKNTDRDKFELEKFIRKSLESHIITISEE